MIPYNAPRGFNLYNVDIPHEWRQTIFEASSQQNIGALTFIRKRVEGKYPRDVQIRMAEEQGIPLALLRRRLMQECIPELDEWQENPDQPPPRRRINSPTVADMESKAKQREANAKLAELQRQVNNADLRHRHEIRFILSPDVYAKLRCTAGGKRKSVDEMARYLVMRALRGRFDAEVANPANMEVDVDIDALMHEAHVEAEKHYSTHIIAHDKFRNHYEHCGMEWTDDSPHQTNDRCPVCHAEVEPYKSEDLHEHDT